MSTFVDAATLSTMPAVVAEEHAAQLTEALAQVGATTASRAVLAGERDRDVIVEATASDLATREGGGARDWPGPRAPRPGPPAD